MRPIRSLTAALMVGALLAPNVALAGGISTADLEKQILTLKRQMDALTHQNAVQQRKIERLEHGLALTQPKRAKKTHAVVVARRVVPAPAPMTAASTGFSSSPIAQFANETTGVPRTQYDPPGSAPAPQGASSALGKQGPAQGSVQSVYEQQNALFNKGLTITPGATYTYGSSRFFTAQRLHGAGRDFLRQYQRESSAE